MIGEIINGKYQILDLIGTGGMARVYKAVNLNNRRTVAIKMLKPEYTEDPEFLRRFEREARATLQLSHDNIVRALGVGQFRGLPYIVLEYVEGPTLKKLISSSGALPLKSAISITCQVLDAIATAHGHGLIHRDIKPQNIIITGRGRVKLTDFGIARDAEATTRTFSGSEVIGSVHYISPEQAKGEDVSLASDIYSLGVTLYEMLTGQVPYSGDSSVSVALMHLQNEPIPPNQVNPTVPRALSDIVLRAMAKDPTERYPDCKTMRRDLVRALSDPDGNFVWQRPSENGQSKSPQKRAASTYIWIAALVVTPILLILFWFIGFQSQCLSPVAEPTPAPTPTASPDPTAAPEETPAAGFAKMPFAEGLSLADALRLLSEAGFANIFVTVQTEADETLWDKVADQSHRANIVLAATEPIHLTVTRASPGKYKADISFNVDIPENESLVQIAFVTSNTEDISYHLVVFTAVRAAESNATVTATVYSNDPVIRTLLLLINGEVVREQDVKFSE
ncbi:MAG: protein kinase [Clostridiales bacterium]|nr:protein kinase [Clostridiales bacterium]